MRSGARTIGFEAVRASAGTVGREAVRSGAGAVGCEAVWSSARTVGSKAGLFVRIAVVCESCFHRSPSFSVDD